ncbi:hypothetical protein [Candidatus Symbiobacter mobilis]|uniref:Uncharacterized protein n=1 Tax=Candidatus Symbiobacter mobilis CR TaxID=946483 RepID=U5NB77_9BURK|nr:hypothetical protein [Candidatus Symbiobacter mobilis]AGX87419.1 hypothetical protein Cenrod_1329 [Candidatus Symbiobacter mobilis CR]
MNNPQPIELALTADLRLSQAALIRAAQRAREVAMQTGTAIVVLRHGVLTYVQPTISPQPPAVVDESEAP